MLVRQVIFGRTDMLQCIQALGNLIIYWWHSASSMHPLQRPIEWMWPWVEQQKHRWKLCFKCKLEGRQRDGRGPKMTTEVQKRRKKNNTNSNFSWQLGQGKKHQRELNYYSLLSREALKLHWWDTHTRACQYVFWWGNLGNQMEM